MLGRLLKYVDRKAVFLAKFAWIFNFQTTAFPQKFCYRINKFFAWSIKIRNSNFCKSYVNLTSDLWLVVCTSYQQVGRLSDSCKSTRTKMYRCRATPVITGRSLETTTCNDVYWTPAISRSIVKTRVQIVKYNCESYLLNWPQVVYICTTLLCFA